ncbi:peptidoglycan DD-metalloendopeptidase family protein [Hymenobacter sp. BT664]|uniref:Peptidoglycan DD-metalloendopeptidase family protein n=1 Tax=Hymenobacter montanus TaxID=2771359 RepID=A0A927BH95_9BACT|nr:peptidoglycan DD-metalloendopeptidase family protein [Hymenobacter montanus]MBD2770416.1 peptidoglycan DD-metalloendopeptidase family protein [Hymenobacter montanus]
MKKSICTLVVSAFCALPGAAQAQRAQAVFYQQDRLYTAAPKGQPVLVGKQLATKPGRLAATTTVALYPHEIDASLTIPADMVFFQGLQSPHQPEWVYLERAEIGNAYNLWLYTTTTRRKQLLFSQPDSPVAGYALKPIAWSADQHVLYLEALKFDTDLEHEGVWSFDLRTRQVQRLALAPKYFSTPVLSPDRQQLLYAVSTSARRDLLHGFADEVAVYDLATSTETIVAQQKDVPHSVAGWALGPLTAADADASANPTAPATAARTSGIDYRLPWDANRQYYVSRHGTPAPTGPHTPTGSRSTIYDGISPHGYAAVDFDTPNDADDNVRAAAPGTVVSAGYCGDDCGYGNLVVIQHSDGTRTYYGHNKRVLVKAGQTVQTGTIVAIEGTTGRSSGDHIHFEWRAAGGNVATLGTFSDVGQPRQGWKYLSTTPNGGGTPPPVPTDTTVPTTSMATTNGSSTQSGDFTVNFTDADNVGVAERFYQPLEYYATTSEWRANRGNGFFNDNFGTGTLHSDYTLGADDWKGSWSVVGGRLRQSDLGPTNTAISTFLSQVPGNTYLYHFAAKLLGDVTARTGRFGIHIMASDVTLRERGNSYLIWFSNNDQKVRIIETSNNVLTERASADVTIPAGEFADYKVSYNTTNGEIRVYQNNRLALTWTDTTPLTSGNYLSLRTNQAQVEFDDLKVYKARGTSRSITVGPALSKDLRQVSTSSTTPAGKIKSLVRDASNNWSAMGNLDLIITPPAAAQAAEFQAELYPNPVEAKATLAYDLPNTGPVTVAVIDGYGKKILTLLDSSQVAGAHELPLAPLAKLRPGTYYVHIQAGARSSVRRFVKN